ncbi:LodA/GoxA family CTQ-dependent oxidase [Candidatus Albibeggiatoa sp. nov. BB20]|uniref:LodA/GoxA family CTQ-dependent oxidase n=1 Tax=Candidatus Albibeggiatoa sp. nov. BB20 TaxID=3162723 RepID=UPI003365A9B7
MTFPNDLCNVKAFKIHPAIGVARLANNEDYYEFFESEKKRKKGESFDYMSEQNGLHWMKRQAVQFKIFAYDDTGCEIGELTEAIMSQLGLKATWTAHIANRKLNNRSNCETAVVEAIASASGEKEAPLKGKNPLESNGREEIWLGSITGKGLFIPPKGGVYRKTATTEIPSYKDHWYKDNGIQDTTSDGSINVALEGINDTDIIPACVIVAPQQHSPDVIPSKNVDTHNKNFLKVTRHLLHIPENASLEGNGYQMDIDMMNTINGDYHPGMEVCLAERGNEVLPNPSEAFYPRGEMDIAKYEIRPRYKKGMVEHGALTGGLCSAWQTDLTECLAWWTAEYPNILRFKDEPNDRFLSRKQFTDNDDRENRMDNPEDLNAYVDMMGVARKKEGSSLLYERERVKEDNAGKTPQPPFSLHPTDNQKG